MYHDTAQTVMLNEFKKILQWGRTFHIENDLRRRPEFTHWTGEVRTTEMDAVNRALIPVLHEGFERLARKFSTILMGAAITEFLQLPIRYPSGMVLSVNVVNNVPIHLTSIHKEQLGLHIFTVDILYK